MSMPVPLLLSFMTGVLLGTAYFSGLWYTLKRLPDSGRPFASLFWSFGVRASVVLTGFYLVMDGRWDRLLAALLGFILTREILVRRLGRRAV